MFDIGWTEITFILIFAIIVIGPKELPRVLRTVGQWVGKAKSMTRDFRGHVDDMIRDTELDEVKKQIDSVGSFDANSALENTIDSDGEIKSAFDFSGDDFSNPVDLNDPSYADPLDNDVLPDGEAPKKEPQKLSKGSLEDLPPETSKTQKKEIKD
jgi:sec-independent protein translocase protein TatB